jgi:hypothetical protein
MTNGIRLRVERFANALALALFDRELEFLGEKITYYYDTDVIFKMIMGLEVEVAGSSASSEELLVRALLSCGYLGEFCMLRPHAFELNEELRRQKQFSTVRDQNAFLAKARGFLRSKQILEIMSVLHDVATGDGAFAFENENARVRHFLGILKDSPGRTFACIEQVNGTWWERLQRYYDKELLCLHKLGPEVQELLRTHEEVLRRINAILLMYRPRYTINVFQDAVALTILHELIRARDEGASNEIVRFYTETAPMREAIYSNESLRGLLSYQTLLAHEVHTPPGAEVVVRDSNYFIMRAWFEELALEAADADMSSLEALKSLSMRLEDLLYLRGDSLEKAISGVRHDGRELGDLIDAFEKLAIMDYVWAGGRVPSDLRELEVLRKWVEVFEFAERPDTDVIVFEQIREVRAELESRVSTMRVWTSDFERLLRATVDTRSRVRGRVTDLMRDLGLVRWGYVLSYNEREHLLDALESLLQEDAINLTVEVSRIAAQIQEARYEMRQCLVMCGMLWALGCFQYIVDLVSECKDNNKDEQLPPSLLVIQAAAEIRTGELGNRDARRETVNQVWELQMSVPGNQRAGILLGVGYVLYHAWKLEWIASGLGVHETHELGVEIQEWAQRSFSLGEEAYKLLRVGELAWSYSINHCAYVGIVTGVEPEKTWRYLDELVRLETLPAFWNARFADTIGSYYLLRAERVWNKSSEELRKGLDLAEDFVRARKYFDWAKEHSIGDIDVEEHINRLNMLKDKYEQLQRTLGEREGGRVGAGGG